MSRLYKVPSARISDCLNSLYKAHVISREKTNELLDMSTEASRTGDWDEMRKQLFELRASSGTQKRLIDNAIDATREKTGGNVL